jgi:hypothetical protein
LANLLAWANTHPRVEEDVDPEAEPSSFWYLLQEAKAERAAQNEGGARLLTEGEHCDES